MTTGLRAIETHYRGYRFRSRLEARWAVFFDALSIPYQYEAEGWDLDGNWYLPDFKLTRGEMACSCSRDAWEAFGWLDGDLHSWVEIKPPDVPMGIDSIRKLGLLAQSSRHAAVILKGEPYTDAYSAARTRGHGWQKRLLWSECPVCGTVDLQPDGGLSGWSREEEGYCPLFYCAHCDVHAQKEDDPLTATWHKGFWIVRRHAWQPTQGPKLSAAFNAARGARFEHGESGAPR